MHKQFRVVIVAAFSITFPITVFATFAAPDAAIEASLISNPSSSNSSNNSNSNSNSISLSDPTADSALIAELSSVSSAGNKSADTKEKKKDQKKKKKKKSKGKKAEEIIEKNAATAEIDLTASRETAERENRTVPSDRGDFKLEAPDRTEETKKTKTEEMKKADGEIGLTLEVSIKASYADDPIKAQAFISILTPDGKRQHLSWFNPKPGEDRIEILSEKEPRKIAEGLKEKGSMNTRGTLESKQTIESSSGRLSLGGFTAGSKSIQGSPHGIAIRIFSRISTARFRTSELDPTGPEAWRTHRHYKKPEEGPTCVVASINDKKIPLKNVLILFEVNSDLSSNAVPSIDCIPEYGPVQ